MSQLLSGVEGCTILVVHSLLLHLSYTLITPVRLQCSVMQLQLDLHCKLIDIVECHHCSRDGCWSIALLARGLLQAGELGEGSYGIVYKAKNLRTNKIVAMKKIRLECENEGVPSTSVRKISILRELRHPNIVSLEDVILQESRLYLVFEWLSMDLKKYLRSLAKNEFLTDCTLRSFLMQITQAMCFCHQRSIIHRDLKPENLLVDGRGSIKLADFGLARAIIIPVRAYTPEVLTLWYRAPELLLGGKKYCMGVDQWSIGCIFAEMATKKALFPGDSEIGQLYSIFSIKGTPTEAEWPGVTAFPAYTESFGKWSNNILRAKLINRLGESGCDLLQAMLEYDPVRRISSRATLSHAYFNGLNMRKLPAGDWKGQLVLQEHVENKQ